MVWGCFSWNGVGSIHVIDDTLTSAKYVRILSDHMLQSSRKLFDKDFKFQQDNAPKHRAKNTLNWLKNNNIEIIDWPPQSPDLNPIENLWKIVKTEINKLKLKKKDEIQEQLNKSWNSIDLAKCKSLVVSMPKRIDEVLANKGGWTKY